MLLTNMQVITMKKSPVKTLFTVAALSFFLTGCSSIEHDDKHAATKAGAIGGALIGLTLGALTGDANLAAKGAVAGGVAGGVAGSSVDLENSRESKRSNNRDEAISNIGNNNSTQTKQIQDHNWKELNNFMGEWDVSIAGMHANKPAKATAKANGILVKTTQAEVKIAQVLLDGKLVDINLTTKFSYSVAQGYSAVVKNETNNQEVHFSGEYQPALNRYNCYPTSGDAILTTGSAAQNFHLQLGFAGANVWVLDTIAMVEGQETKVQSYRFNKKG